MTKKKNKKNSIALSIAIRSHQWF